MAPVYNPIFVLIDDDFDDLELIKLGLEKHNAQSNILAFSNGAGALDFLSDEKHKISPSLFIVDWNMPYMNGLEFMESLRQMDNYKSIPSLIYSTDIGRVPEEAKAKLYLKALNKSYSIDELDAHIRIMFDMVNHN